MNYSFDKKAVKELLQDSSTYAFVLLAIVLQFLPEGEDDLAEIDDTSVLFADLEDEFDCNIPEENETKINAAITALTTDLFWRSYQITKSITLAFLEGDIGDLVKGEDEEVEACYILWAALEVGLIHDLSFTDSLSEFNPDIISNINELLDSEAEDREDEEVDQIQETMREPYYHRYISYNLLKLTQQLYKLGINNNIIKELWTTYTDCVDDLSQEEEQ